MKTELLNSNTANSKKVFMLSVLYKMFCYNVCFCASLGHSWRTPRGTRTTCWKPLF